MKKLIALLALLALCCTACIGKTFIPEHFESVGKRSLVIPNGCNSVLGQSLGQILKR